MIKKRALGLMSGGLDSILATRLLLEQGIEVVCVNFYTGFCIQTHTRAMRNPTRGKPSARHDALHAAELLDVPLLLEDISESYVDIVINPKFGYGANLNPCLDCKIFMIKKAWEIKQRDGFDFLFTGEVVGERPMSQRRDTMPLISRQADVDGWLLRPLSAQVLPETEPERRGWVDRNQLCGITGRSRKPQMALARRFGIVDYPSPAGGCCFLTDENYSRKLLDLWEHRGEKRYSQEEILLLKAGRHLRPTPRFKIIIGRDHTENQFLKGFCHGRVSLRARDLPGPLALVEGDPDEEDLLMACRLTAFFGKGRSHNRVVIAIERKDDGPDETCDVAPFMREEIDRAWYL